MEAVARPEEPKHLRLRAAGECSNRRQPVPIQSAETQVGRSAPWAISATFSTPWRAMGSPGVPPARATWAIALFGLAPLLIAVDSSLEQRLACLMIYFAL